MTFAVSLVAACLQAGADEIVVTGERRARAAAASPFSVSTIASEDVVRIAADHPAEALNRAAGVLIHRGNGQEHLTAIRSPVLTGGAGAGSFLFLEDGVPLRSAGFANVNELLEAHSEIAGRIEIVRGPSGAAYGANAIHGVINVITRAAEDEFGYFLDTSADTIGRVKGRAFVSDTKGPHGFFAGVSILNDPGFRAESGADQQKLTLRHDWTGERVSVSTIGAVYNLNQETAGFVQGPDAYLDEALRQQNANPNSFRDAKGVRLLSRIDAALSDTLTLSVTPYARANDMTFRLHFFPSQALESNAHWSAGAQNALYWDTDGKFSFIAGLDIEYTKGDLSEVQEIPTIGTFTQGVHYDYDVAAFSVSPFASATVEIAPRLSATAAARLDHTRYEYENLTADGVVGRFLRPPSRTDRFTTVSPKFSLTYDAGDAVIYTSYARGARPPQTTDLYRLQNNQTADPAQPETIDAFELGVKGARAGLRYEAAGYFMAKRNFFFRDADGFNVNDGRTRHVGGEAEIGADLPLGFAIDAQASYGRHTYRFARPILSVPQASEAISFGDDVDTAPRWIAGARVRWMSPEDRFETELEWQHLGPYFLDAANSATYPGHDLVHLRAQWLVTERLAVTFALRNVLDKLYAERGDIAFGNERYFPGEERTAAFGIRIEG
ncbi:MAG: TonB-dependent receptor [Parvularculaceae bacterium]|nr:TonB-dependent receptor [Parvularculaceae bacterium]